MKRYEHNFGKNPQGALSTVSGYATETTNFGETAFGILNKSTIDKNNFTTPEVVSSSTATLFSVGNGTDTDNRKNIIELKADGTVFISGVGGYDGTNPEDSKDISKELQSVHDDIDNINLDIDRIDSDIDSIHVEQDSDLVYTFIVKGENRGTINIPRDQFLKDVNYDEETNILEFLFIVRNEENEEEQKVVKIDMTDLEDIYTNGDGLNLENKQFSIKIDADTQPYINVGPNGLKIIGVNEALDKKVSWDESKKVITLPADGSISALRNNGLEGGVLVCQRTYDDGATYVTEVGTTKNNLTLNSIERPKIDFAGGASENIAYESEVKSLQDRMSTAETDIDNLEGRMDTAEGDIDTIQSDLSELIGDGEGSVQDQIKTALEDYLPLSGGTMTGNITFGSESAPDTNGHEYVDLGLPSGNLWAKCNIGANTEEEAGLYFQWGDTQGYTVEQVGDGEGLKAFRWADYKFGSPYTNFSKYNVSDSKTILDLEDDAAHVNMGDNWRMPTLEEYKELLFNTDIYLVPTEGEEIQGTVQEQGTIVKINWASQVEGTFKGVKFYKKGDKQTYMFVPVAGRADEGSILGAGNSCGLWSSSHKSSGGSQYAQKLYFYDGDYFAILHDESRSVGLPVRGVLPKSDSADYTGGIIISGKSDTDLVNAVGGTTTIDSIREGLATEDALNEYKTSNDEKIQSIEDKLDQEIEAGNTDKETIDNYTVNGHKISENPVLTKTDVGLNQVDNVQQIPMSMKGQAGGVAELDANGKVPSSQLDGQLAHVFGVDGVVANQEALPTEGVIVGDIYYTTEDPNFYNYNGTSWDAPMAPKDDTIYNFRNSDATGDTSRTNILYRWDGATLVEISASLALGEVAGTAYEGNKGAANKAAIGTNTYTGANYISKETNLTDAVLQLDEEIKATNDNLALEHTNAEATYAKKTELGNYLPLSGGTMDSSSMITIGNNMDMPYITLENNNIYLYKQGSRKDYTNVTYNGIRIVSPGIVEPEKLLLHAAGGTVSISAIGTQLGESTLATKEELAEYLPLSGGTLTGNIVLEEGNSLRVLANSLNWNNSDDNYVCGLNWYDPENTTKLGGICYYNRGYSDPENTSWIGISANIRNVGAATDETWRDQEGDYLFRITATQGVYYNTHKLVENTELSNYLTKTAASNTYQPKGNYLTAIPSEYVTDSELNAKGYQTEAQVAAKVASLVDSAPETLDTLNELAAALGDDPNFATTVTNQIAQKADKTTATTSTAGLMSATDKDRIDKLYTSLSNFGPITHVLDHNAFTQEDGNLKFNFVCTDPASGSTSKSNYNLNVPLATQSQAGAMSASDKSKLDGIASGANKTTVDSALSSTSTNPVQNKVINSAFAGKANASHTHAISDITNLQSTLDGKAASSHTHPVSQITGLTASRALVSDSNGHPAVSAVTSTELGYLDGVTSNVQTQLNGKAASSHTHTVANISNLGSNWATALTAAKPNWITSVNIATISDLNANWDALLKSNPSGYVTRWPNISEVGSKQNLVVKLNGGTTEGTNQFTYNATAAKSINITPSSIGAAASSHTHTASQVSGLATVAKSGNYNDLSNKPSIPQPTVKAASGNLTLWTGTEAEYNDIATKDPNTLYFILES